jgi:hypothetical protein
VIGTSSQLMCARALRLIEKHWGADWFARIPDDVRSLNQTLGPAQRGRRTTDVVYPEEPAEHQLRVELVTPGSKRNAPPTTAKSGKQKRRRLGSGALNLVHQVDNQEGGWRVSEDGRWRLERDGNQLLRLPVNGVDIPSNREASLSSGSRENTPNPIDGVSRSIAVTSDRLRCYGPAFASRLRGVAKMLAGPAQDASDMAVGKNHCCAQCSPNLAASDGVISEITRIAAALEAVTGHHFNDSDPVYSPHPQSVPATLQLPRNRRWWLPIESDSDDGR